MGEAGAGALEEMWAESDRRFQVRRRLQLNAERFRYHDTLACVFGRMAAHHAEEAQRLLEPNDEGEGEVGS